MAKRYYWLKLPDGFFRQKAIKKLRKIAGGDTYTIIYLKMLLVAMKQDGRLYFEGVEATFYDELEGKVLVVIVDHKDKAKNIYGTVTHNRARGTHLLEPMKKIVKELMDEGKTVEEIGKQLGMRPEEIFRLSDFSKEDFLKMMTKGVTGYSKAEFITKI